ncbi:hypothetical protein [Pseudarthrobacter sp. S9]|uniref:hypothetical protein n=1 Tax=Pseudarthrobacter sp. S9 TaxID=3418421 RepID=UPI003D05F5E5
MPQYHFTGIYPRVLIGLSQGVNADLTPAEGEAPVHGVTIEARPGDVVRTDEPYEHPELAEAPVDPPPTESDGAPIPAPEPVVPIQLVATEDPAHDAMTAEGAPAPAEPTA